MPPPHKDSYSDDQGIESARNSWNGAPQESNWSCWTCARIGRPNWPRFPRSTCTFRMGQVRRAARRTRPSHADGRHLPLRRPQLRGRALPRGSRIHLGIQSRRGYLGVVSGRGPQDSAVLRMKRYLSLLACCLRVARSARRRTCWPSISVPCKTIRSSERRRPIGWRRSNRSRRRWPRCCRSWLRTAPSARSTTRERRIWSSPYRCRAAPAAPRFSRAFPSTAASRRARITTASTSSRTCSAGRIGWPCSARMRRSRRPRRIIRRRSRT